jgi:hypothetical protein
VDLVEGQVVDEVGKKYTCTSTDTCTKRKMVYKEMCMHMPTSHDVVGTIIREKMMVNVKEERITDIKSEPTTPVRRKRGPASRVKVEPSQAHTPITYMEEEDWMTLRQSLPIQ